MAISKEKTGEGQWILVKFQISVDTEEMQNGTWYQFAPIKVIIYQSKTRHFTEKWRLTADWLFDYLGGYLS